MKQFCSVTVFEKTIEKEKEQIFKLQN